MSSNIFTLSKNSSTDAAVSESAPRSINSAPRDIIPSGILIAPDANPAPKALYQLVSLLVSAEINDLLSSAIYSPIFFVDKKLFFRSVEIQIRIVLLILFQSLEIQ